MSNPNDQPERQSLPGHGRDWRYYAAACTVAGAITATVPFFTRRTHLPMSVTEPAMVYSRRMASRAFMYATCINMFAGIGIVAASAFYCEIDNVNDIGWKFRQKFRSSGMHDSSAARSVRDSSQRLQSWIAQTSLGKSLAEAVRVDESALKQSGEGEQAVESTTETVPTHVTDDDVEQWTKQADAWLADMLTTSNSADSNNATTPVVDKALTSSTVAVPVTSPTVQSVPPPSGGVEGGLRDFDRWFEQTSVGKWLTDLQKGTPKKA